MIESVDTIRFSLILTTLLSYLNNAIDEIPDPRKPSNAKIHSFSDIVLSGFAVFFMQCKSFLEYQRQVQQQQGKDNAQTFFGIKTIPSDNQIRNVLDQVCAKFFFPIFLSVYLALQQGEYLESYRVLEENLLVAIDGVKYFSSKKVHCQCCSHTQHKDGSITYFHQALLPVIVAPENPHVISLPPEFITPQDGHDKQDCEVQAAKRWITQHQDWFGTIPVTLLGDDLYAHQPLCQDCLSCNFNFIFTCLETSHPTLYEWLKFLDAHQELKDFEHRYWDEKTKQWHLYRFRYCNGVPLRDGEDALKVNWFEVKVIRVRDGQQLYLNTFVTNHFLQESVMSQMALAARARWKTENENHNILKTKGYDLEHNFGHGEQYLSQVLFTLNVLAFLFHTVLHLADEAYQCARKLLGPRKRFFDHIRTLTCYFVFDSWQQLLEFIVAKTQPRKLSTNTS